jgi:hypothetical protein
MGFQRRLVVPPCLAVHAPSRILLQREECRVQPRDIVDVPPVAIGCPITGIAFAVALALAIGVVGWADRPNIAVWWQGDELHGLNDG